MTEQVSLCFTFFCLLGIFAGCEPVGTNPDGFDLEVRAEPSTAGIVLTSGLAEGDAEAIAIPNRGWQFGYWSGDLESFENPLAVELDRDMELVANFSLFENEYSFDISVSGSQNSVDLVFGQKPGATDGFDTNIDQETPPPPPGNMVYAWFDMQDKKLRHDFRNAFTDQITWNLRFLEGESESLTIQWEFTEERFSGSLVLTDPDNDFTLDMLEEDSATIDPQITDSLLIIYNYE